MRNGYYYLMEILLNHQKPQLSNLENPDTKYVILF